MYVADKLRALKLREAKAWKVIDAYMADRKDKKIPAHVRLEAAVFVLKRLYPEKLNVGGDSENPIAITIKIEKAEIGDNVQTARQAVSNIFGSN